VDPKKFAAFNVLEDEDLRQGTVECMGSLRNGSSFRNRDQGVLGMAHDTTAICRQRVCRRV